MNPLYDPGRHQPLAAIPWNAAAAREAVERIVEDTWRSANSEGLWPIHPNDGPISARPLTNLYCGATGVIWALDDLARRGVASRRDFAEALPHVLALNRQAHSKRGLQNRSYLMADAGILLTHWKIAPSADIADALAETIAANTDDATQELMWGAPGTMIAALAMHRWTGEARWAALFRAGAEVLERSYVFDEECAVRIWTQDLYGHRLRYFGAVHGFAGVAFALIAGRDLLHPETWSGLSPDLARTFTATALRGEAGSNWSAGVGPARPGRAYLAQFCHGAPGMVLGLSQSPEPIDDLLLEAGELIWAAGPLAKGANLCHGTAGNGYAFQKLFERTGAETWLDRARAFAMHAITQSEKEAEAIGLRRYSLWTGDLGLAIYLMDCIDGRARFPTLDVT